MCVGKTGGENVSVCRERECVGGEREIVWGECVWGGKGVRERVCVWSEIEARKSMCVGWDWGQSESLG